MDAAKKIDPFREPNSDETTTVIMWRGIPVLTEDALEETLFPYPPEPPDEDTTCP